jgi:hypothetical protein
VEHGIIYERTLPYSLQYNGVAERKNRTLTSLVNTMLEILGLSKEWWGEVILTCHVPYHPCGSTIFPGGSPCSN